VAGCGCGLEHEVPRLSDVGERFARRVGERDGLFGRADGAALFEKGNARVAIQGDGKRTAPTPPSIKSAAIVWVITRRLVVISCRSRCARP